MKSYIYFIFLFGREVLSIEETPTPSKPSRFLDILSRFIFLLYSFFFLHYDTYTRIFLRTVVTFLPKHNSLYLLIYLTGATSKNLSHLCPTNNSQVSTPIKASFGQDLLLFFSHIDLQYPFIVEECELLP